jgi:hypothetical protein
MLQTPTPSPTDRFGTVAVSATNQLRKSRSAL